MKNEEKASEIVINIQNSSSLDYDGRRAKYMYDSAMEMAKWKDEQFKEMLQSLPQAVKDLIDTLINYNEKEDDSKE